MSHLSNLEDPMPAVLEEMCRQGSEHLMEHQVALQQLVKEYQDVFSLGPNNIGCTDLVQHKRHGERPSYSATTSTPTDSSPWGCCEELKRMREAGVVVPSGSPWASPSVFVSKKDGSARFCVDYSRLNNAKLRDSYPILRTDDVLDALAGSRWFSTLDPKSGY